MLEIPQTVKLTPAEEREGWIGLIVYLGCIALLAGGFDWIQRIEKEREKRKQETGIY